jgi:predicted O-methyltransferase YrrM
MSRDFPKLRSVIDVLLCPFALAGVVANMAVSRWSGRLPLCTSIFDCFHVYPIRHHYYSPLVYESDLRVPLAKERIINGLDLNQQEQFDVLEKFDFQAELLAIPLIAVSPLAFGYGNDRFGPGDAEYLYDIIRHFKPKKILEIGSGQSTLIARLAIDANRREVHTYDCEQICVEPFEEPWLEQTGATVHRTKIEELDPAIIESLEDNDILFIDSSHVIRPQGDVTYEFLSILGSLRQGVIIHVHDIFTPRDYPEAWVLRNRRLWNEQYLLEAFLCFNSSFKVIGAVNWLWHNHPSRLTRACPVLSMHGGEPGSFWFKRIKR